MLEDKCRCRTGHTAANLALLRGVALKIWRKSRPKLTASNFIRSNNKNVDRSNQPDEQKSTTYKNGVRCPAQEHGPREKG